MDKEVSYGRDYKYIPTTSITSGQSIEISPYLYSNTNQIETICLVGNPESESKDFILIDAGLPEAAEEFISVTVERFGKNSCPKSIILTHGHFVM